MNPEHPVFDAQEAAVALRTFGYFSRSIDIPEDVIRAFAAQHGATCTRGFFNWMVKLSTEPDPKDREAYFEKIRKDRFDHRQKLAATGRRKRS